MRAYIQTYMRMPKYMNMPKKQRASKLWQPDVGYPEHLLESTSSQHICYMSRLRG